MKWAYKQEMKNGEGYRNRRRLLKSKSDNAALAAWYRKHLGMSLEDFGGAILRWPNDKAEDQGLTVWHVCLESHS